MWKPRSLRTLWASTACYRVRFYCEQDSNFADGDQPMRIHWEQNSSLVSYCLRPWEWRLQLLIYKRSSEKQVYMERCSVFLLRFAARQNARTVLCKQTKPKSSVSLHSQHTDITGPVRKERERLPPLDVSFLKKLKPTVVPIARLFIHPH
jgi:hypothetical protein